MRLKEIKPGMAIQCNSFEEALLLYGWFYQNGYVRKEVEADLFENFIDCWKTAPYGIEIYPRTWTTMDGAKEITPFSSIIIEDKTYEDGLNEAWSAANKLADMMGDTLNAVFGFNDAELIRQGTTPFGKAMSLTPQEVITKLEAYEAENQIKIGDVAKHTNTEFVVTCVESGFILGIDKLGRTHCFVYPNSLIKKTGKHIDISSILAEIGKE